LGQTEKRALNLDWSTISQIASSVGIFVTAISVVIAATSLFIGLRRYQSSQQKAYISTLRKTIFDSTDSLRKVSTTIASYDFAYEMAFSVAHSKPMMITINEMYEAYFRPLTDENVEKDGPPLHQELSSYVNTDTQWKTILVPIHTELVEVCDSLTTQTGREIEPYRFEYPSLARVFLSVNMWIANLLSIYRNYFRRDDIWKSAIIDVHRDFAQTVDSAEELEVRITERMIGKWVEDRINGQNDGVMLDKLREIVAIVTKTYLASAEPGLLSVRKRESIEQFVPLEQTTTITQDLDEAYKGLRWVLSDLDKQTYHDLVREIH